MAFPRPPKYLSGKMPSDALKLWVTLARAYRTLAEVSADDVARHGLTPAEFGVLEALHHRGPLLLGDLQRKVLVSSGGMTYLVDRLAERGLVERADCAEDRRARYARLTETGRALIERIFPAHAEAMREACRALTPAEQRETAALLKRLGLGPGEPA